MLLLVSCQQSVKVTQKIEPSATNLWVSGYYVGYISYPVPDAYRDATPRLTKAGSVGITGR
jgi:hypothetical protein